jgi:UDP-N-acetylmuramoyl-tripeptide--D-alanyl-D-alanine ligase
MFTLGDIARAVGGEIVRGASQLQVVGVSTDSRTIQMGELFVALRGPTFDGHQFLEAALARGAAAALVARDAPPPAGEIPFVAAADTLRALGDLAAWHRRRYPIPLVAVTGSAGKTSTKEMVAAILAAHGPTLSTRGNLNNLVGLPLTLFGLDATHRFAVLEMGMSAQGEIARLAEIARPSVGVVTNVGLAHTEHLGGLEGVARAKGELFAALGEGDHAALNLDDPRLSALRPAIRARLVTFGRSPKAEVRLVSDPEISLAGTRARISVRGEALEIEVPQIGAHQAENALAAIAATLPLGFAPAEMAAALRVSSAVPGRMTVREAPELTLLDDTYNANPSSMAMALYTLAALAGSRRPVAVLGDMLELGEHGPAAHREVGRLAAREARALFAFGTLAAEMAQAARDAGLAEVTHATDLGELTAALLNGLRRGDLVLVKGSRGMRMERVVRALGAGTEGH